MVKFGLKENQSPTNFSLSSVQKRSRNVIPTLRLVLFHDKLKFVGHLDLLFRFVVIC